MSRGFSLHITDAEFPEPLQIMVLGPTTHYRRPGNSPLWMKEGRPIRPRISI